MLRKLLLLTAAPLLLVTAQAVLNAGEEKTPVEPPQGGEGKPGVENPKGAEDPLAEAAKAIGGEWIAEPGDTDESKPHGRFVSEWGVSKKYIRDRTYWHAKGKVNQIYEGGTYYHPGKKQVVFFQVGAGGAIYEGVITQEDGQSVSTWTAYEGDKEVQYKQASKYLDDDTMESTVYVKEGDAWKQMHAFKFHRKKTEAK